MDAQTGARRRSRRLTALAALLAGCAGDPEPDSVPARPDGPARRPDILIVVADDWSFPHAGVYGDKTVRTPAFDRMAAQGALFTNAYCASPSCTPSRAAMFTGQAIHRLGEGANLYGALPRELPLYVDLLESAGYAVGFTGKGWGPGDIRTDGRTRNPAGPEFRSFDAFLKIVPPDRPFCFWYGSHEPHRPYALGAGAKLGLRPESVAVPAFLPDTPVVRGDLLDYYSEVMSFDLQLAGLLRTLDGYGRAERTLVVVTSDNGMPFPRGKAGVYDAGTRMPLAVRWPGRVTDGMNIDGFVGLCDVAPTFLEAAGVKPPPGMTGRSLIPLLAGHAAEGRDRIFLERERHANVRKGDFGYPCRAIRTEHFLYIRNLRPDRWPAGDPEFYFSVGPFGDIDDSPTKRLLMEQRDDPAIAPFFRRAMEKRPAEELYDLDQDPEQLRNIVDDDAHASAKAELRAALDRWMIETADPRAAADDDRWDRYPYHGPGPKTK